MKIATDRIANTKKKIKRTDDKKKRVRTPSTGWSYKKKIRKSNRNTTYYNEYFLVYKDRLQLSIKSRNRYKYQTCQYNVYMYYRDFYE